MSEPTKTGDTPVAATPTATPSPTPTPSPSINLGMGPKNKGGSSSADTGQTLYDEKWWGQHGENIFKHDRFKELSGYKEKWSAVEPLVNEFGSQESLASFTSYLGPVWKALGEMPQDQANSVWQSLYPVLNAILNKQDIKKLLAGSANASPEVNAGGDESDPIAKELTTVKQELNSLKTDWNQSKEQKRLKDEEKTKRSNLDKYESLFQEKMDALKAPKDEIVDGKLVGIRKDLGDLLASRFINYVPVDPKTGKKPNVLLMAHSKELFDKVFENEILPAWKRFSKAGVEGAIDTVNKGGPAVPNSNGQGGTPAGNGSYNRQQKSSRMAQFFTTGR